MLLSAGSSCLPVHLAPQSCFWYEKVGIAVLAPGTSTASGKLMPAELLHVRFHNGLTCLWQTCQFSADCSKFTKVMCIAEVAGHRTQCCFFCRNSLKAKTRGDCAKTQSENLNCLEQRVIALRSLGKDSRLFVFQNRGGRLVSERSALLTVYINSAALYKIIKANAIPNTMLRPSSRDSRILYLLAYALNSLN